MCIGQVKLTLVMEKRVREIEERYFKVSRLIDKLQGEKLTLFSAINNLILDINQETQKEEAELTEMEKEMGIL